MQAGMSGNGTGAYGSIAETMRTGAGFDRRHGLSTQPQNAGSAVQIAGHGRPRRRPFRSYLEEFHRDRIARLKREIRELDPTIDFLEPLGGSSSVDFIRSLEATVRRLKQELAQEKATEEERARAQEKFTEPDIRFRHYTNDDGLKGIKRDKKIRAKDRNRVHGENARKKPLSPAVAEDKYGIGDGRGKNFVETDVEASRVENYKNPTTKWRELRVKGDLKLRNPSFRRRGKGHPQ